MIRVYRNYFVGTFNNVIDSWCRFRVLSKTFLDVPWNGISKIEIRDNADRLIMSVINYLK